MQTLDWVDAHLGGRRPGHVFQVTMRASKVLARVKPGTATTRHGWAIAAWVPGNAQEAGLASRGCRRCRALSNEYGAQYVVVPEVHYEHRDVVVGALDVSE